MTRSNMNNSIILVARHNQIMIISANMIKNWIKQQYTYWVLAFGNTNSADGMKMILRTECSRRRCRRRRRRRYAALPDLDGGQAVAKIVEQSRRAFPKNLIRPLPVQDPKGERFRRPALPFAGACRRSGWRRLRWRRSSKKESKL